MQLKPIKQTVVTAITSEVLPSMGLAYLVDDDNRTWTITRENGGHSFDTLEPGTACELTLMHYPRFTLVDRCEQLN
jgi:hypothetical protein